MQVDKEFGLYLAKTRLQSRMMQNVKSQFENANMVEWIERLAKCRSVKAVKRLANKFELADKIFVDK